MEKLHNSVLFALTLMRRQNMPNLLLSTSPPQNILLPLWFVSL
uniref:Uncharacterized protein n=1 Tax=Onchocerca volvulus TaxID=6282 RepID=A0A2K6WAC9_ONCVO